MTLLIMAAGMGSRYGGLKQIDPIGPNGEFIIDYSIYDAIKVGFDKVVFIIKEENLEDFRDTIGKRIESAIKVEYAFQKITDIPPVIEFPKDRTKPWGTAHAVLSSANLVDDNFAAINADDFYGRNAFELLAKFLKSAKSDDKYHFCMIGYKIENTLTENGHVARGICETKNGHLTTITERTQIQKNNGKIQYCENNEWTNISDTSLASMNCWGFTPEIFGEIKNGLGNFLKASKDNILKAEYFLPTIVNDLMNEKKCDVEVLSTSAKWYGVTYKDDRAEVVKFIKDMISNGTYPERLWK